VTAVGLLLTPVFYVALRKLATRDRASAAGQDSLEASHA
jgi:hypothetical protein